MKNTAHFVTLIFPDGTELAAKSATDALRRLGLIQWTPVSDLAQIKAMLSRRAENWNEATISPTLPDDEFLTALDASGFAAVIWSPHPAATKQPRPQGS